MGIARLKKLPAMTAARRRNLALFQSLFAGDERFIIKRERQEFEFQLYHHPEPLPSWIGAKVFAALTSDIGYRIITGGCFLRHDVIKYYDHDIVGGIERPIWPMITASSSAIIPSI